MTTALLDARTADALRLVEERRLACVAAHAAMQATPDTARQEDVAHWHAVGTHEAAKRAVPPSASTRPASATVRESRAAGDGKDVARG